MICPVKPSATPINISLITIVDISSIDNSRVGLKPCNTSTFKIKKENIIAAYSFIWFGIELPLKNGADKKNPVTLRKIKNADNIMFKLRDKKYIC